MIRLNLGSGYEIKNGFINVDKFYTEKEVRAKGKIEKGNGTYIQADILKLPFKNNFADYVELFNVIEHFPMVNVVNYMKEIYRVMKKGGKLLIVTNNWDGLALDWLDLAVHPFDLNKYVNVAETFYGNQNAPGEVHLCPFNPPFLNFVITGAGFTKGEISVHQKGNPVPKFGTMKGFKKGAVLRNDLIFAEITK